MQAREVPPKALPSRTSEYRLASELTVSAVVQVMSVDGNRVVGRVGPAAAAAADDLLSSNGRRPPDGASGAEPAELLPAKHIVLDAGEGGAIDIDARSWFQSVQDRFRENGAGRDGRHGNKRS